MRYGMNPHQSAHIVAGVGPVVLNGEPSLINYLDALNAFELVGEADRATGQPAAASFKHVSPAGAAIAGAVDSEASRTWGVSESEDNTLLSAYVRARDADPKSSFMDVVALSRPVDTATAQFLRTVISDAVIAPGYEPGALAYLKAKRGGRFLVLEADPTRVPPAVERRDVLGLTIEQDRDAVPVDSALPPEAPLSERQRTDALLGLAALRYTQSNSIVLVRDGVTIGVGAGQQNRVDCVRLAGAKARVWWLRRHPLVTGLPVVAGMGRQDRLNWQIRYAGAEMTRSQQREFEDLFGPDAAATYQIGDWRPEWCAGLSGVTMASDGYLPFRDNIDHAADAGVGVVVAPAGSTRTNEVVAAANELDITYVQTKLRLFHH
jgi:phosphoribosylaminoimidazolecarboxamide formyltransferase/IMP cyclohydrolase